MVPFAAETTAGVAARAAATAEKRILDYDIADRYKMVRRGVFGFGCGFTANVK